MASGYAQAQMLWCKKHREVTIHRPVRIRTRPDNPYKIQMLCGEDTRATGKSCGQRRLVEMKISIGVIHPDDLQHRHRHHGQWCKVGLSVGAGFSRP